LKVNLRHLLPDPRRRLRFWPSAAHFRQASGSVSVSVASGQEGDFFFLDENGVPTATVSGDASKMTAVAFLTANVPYEDAFITADATEKDQPALTDLAEKANPNGGENSPTSNKGSGGCDAGLGVAGLAALLPALTKKRK
ncbi:MAG: SYNERG-CTERM sorting domain-containing protein, partial [Fretibacterium sp.]|nr:SYNERG-CTERM sorting domain-containing protein [Fretibacterium sp.]